MSNVVNGITLTEGSQKDFFALQIFFGIPTCGCKRQIGGIDS